MLKRSSIFRISSRLFHPTPILLSDGLSDFYRERREEEMEIEKKIKEQKEEKNLVKIDNNKINKNIIKFVHENKDECAKTYK